MNLHGVSFFLTDRCSAACRICCFQCSPKNTFVMDKELIKRYIDEGGELGTIKRFSYTGGEVFLYPELLREVVAYGKEKYDILSSTVSNGFWAADLEKGRALMRRMKEAGLASVRLSADNYHQSYVPAQTLKNAIRILTELDMLDAVTIMDIKSRANIRNTIERLRPEIYSVRRVAYYPMHLPEAVLANPEVEETMGDLEMPVSWERSYCVDAGSVQLYTDGYMYKCCSQFSFEMPRMRVGKIGETTLKEAERNMNRDPVLDLICRDSVTWFARKAKELGYPVRENYSMSCELCRDLLCNDELMEKLTPLAEEEVKKRRLEKFLSLCSADKEQENT